MHVTFDEFTEDDCKMLADYQHREVARTSEIMQNVEEGIIVRSAEKREVFTFTSDETGVWHFDVRSIKNAILDGRIPVTMAKADPIPAEFYQHVLNNNGVEPDRLPNINGRDLERPGIMVMWPDGHGSLIDGNHRLCRRYQLGLFKFRFAMILVQDCAPFMCRPGDETKLFARDKKDDPDLLEVLHTEVRMEN